MLSFIQDKLGASNISDEQDEVTQNLMKSQHASVRISHR